MQVLHAIHPDLKLANQHIVFPLSLNSALKTQRMSWVAQEIPETPQVLATHAWTLPLNCHADWQRITSWAFLIPHIETIKTNTAFLMPDLQVKNHLATFSGRHCDRS